MRADRAGRVEYQHDGPYAAGHRSSVAAGCRSGLERHCVACAAQHGPWRFHPQRRRPVAGVLRGEGNGRKVVKVGPLGRLFEPGSQPAVEAEPPEQPSPCPEPVPRRLGLFGLFATIVLERGAVAAVLYGITHVGAGQVVVQLGPGMQIARYCRRRGAARAALRPDWRPDVRRPAGGPPGAAGSGGAERRWRRRCTVHCGCIPSAIAHGSGLPACRISHAAGRTGQRGAGRRGVDEGRPCGRLTALLHPTSLGRLPSRLHRPPRDKMPALPHPASCSGPRRQGWGRGARRKCR